jgi:hypothetical protein
MILTALMLANLIAVPGQAQPPRSAIVTIRLRGNTDPGQHNGSPPASIDSANDGDQPVEAPSKRPSTPPRGSDPSQDQRNDE